MKTNERGAIEGSAFGQCHEREWVLFTRARKRIDRMPLVPSRPWLLAVVLDKRRRVFVNDRSQSGRFVKVKVDRLAMLGLWLTGRICRTLEERRVGLWTFSAAPARH